MSTTINREAFVLYTVNEWEKGSTRWDIFSYLLETFGHDEASAIWEEADAIIKTPVVGNGATIFWWSDSRAGTITFVSPNGKRIIVQVDKATRTDKNGLSDCQSYEYERDPFGSTYEFSLRKNGRWVRVGDSINDGLVCGIGYRQSYHDFSF